MAGDPEDDASIWLRPVWETDAEQDLEPPGSRPVRKPVAEPDYHHPLLTPLARAHDALARLQAKAELASRVVAEGLRSRMSYLEAAGWLRHSYILIHPWDLVLRDHGVMSSYRAAVEGAQLASVLPATVGKVSGFEDVAPSGVIKLDIMANKALALARMWRRLAELRTWRPLARLEDLFKTLKSLGYGGSDRPSIEEWLHGPYFEDRGPVLIRAGQAAREWMNLPGVKESDPEGIFLAACLFCKANRDAPIPLPFWSAPETHHYRLGLKTGIGWMAEFLECVAASALVGLRELSRLNEAEQKSRAIRSTKRSRLPDAVDAVLRAPIVTTTSLAKSLDVSPQAAWALLRQLIAAGIVREATGRSSWRAYILAD